MTELNKTSRNLWIIFTILVTLLILVIWYTIYSNKEQKTRVRLSKIIDVDTIVNYPEQYKGFIGVSGIIIKKIDEANFILGCKDSCIIMPVSFRGKIPDKGSEIIVWGEIKKAKNEKYFFEAKEVKMK